MKKKPIQVLDRKEQVLRSKVIPLVKILWLYHGVEEATWELEASIWKHRFGSVIQNCSMEVRFNFEGKIPLRRGGCRDLTLDCCI